MNDNQTKPVCPECGASDIIKFGMATVVIARTPTKAQRYRCKWCYRIFIWPRKRGEPLQPLAEQ